MVGFILGAISVAPFFIYFLWKFRVRQRKTIDVKSFVGYFNKIIRIVIADKFPFKITGKNPTRKFCDIDFSLVFNGAIIGIITNRAVPNHQKNMAESHTIRLTVKIALVQSNFP